MRILFRNWQLKLGAVALATVLYTGLVFSGSFTEQSLDGVSINTLNQPDETVLLGQPPAARVTYRVISESAGLVRTDSFAATVDLSAYDLDLASQPQSLPVSVIAIPDGITVLGYTPREITIRLDTVDDKQVPVVVDTGDVPPGLELDEPTISNAEVSVRGPASLVARVDHALARVRIDPSGIGIDQPVDLQAVDVDDQPVQPIDIRPTAVDVVIEVRTIEKTRTVPVRPSVEGSPAAGFALENLRVEPGTVTLRGVPADLAGIEEVRTEPLSIAGLSAEQTFDAELILPAAVALADEGAGSVAVTAVIGPIDSSRTYLVGLSCQGAAAGTTCLPQLEQISVTLSGPTATLAQITAGELTPILDVTGLGGGQHNVPPTLGALPEGVEVVSVSVASVPVIIEVPSTPTPTPAPTPP